MPTVHEDRNENGGNEQPGDDDSVEPPSHDYEFGYTLHEQEQLAIETEVNKKLYDEAQLVITDVREGILLPQLTVNCLCLRAHDVLLGTWTMGGEELTQNNNRIPEWLERVPVGACPSSDSSSTEGLANEISDESTIQPQNVQPI